MKTRCKDGRCDEAENRYNERKKRKNQRERERTCTYLDIGIVEREFKLPKCRVIAAARLLGHLFTHFDRETLSVVNAHFEIARIGFYLLR